MGDIETARNLAQDIDADPDVECSACGWAGRVEENVPEGGEARPAFDSFRGFAPSFCPNCGAMFRQEERA